MLLTVIYRGCKCKHVIPRGGIIYCCEDTWKQLIKPTAMQHFLHYSFMKYHWWQM